MNNSLTFVITRPEKQGLQLKQALQRVGINSICQPLFAYQLATNSANIHAVQQSFAPTVVIFVSVAAVEYADLALPLEQWLSSNIKVIAVGDATQSALVAKNIAAICPLSHDTEGMLALPQLSAEQVKRGANILVVRGDGGRELLAEQLANRGANVQYLESYQRVWLPISPQDIDHWRQKNISGFIITSNALLQRVVDLININDNFWQNTCLWIVASERIKQTAQQLGLQNVINAQGASDQAIIDTLLKMEPTDDR